MKHFTTTRIIPALLLCLLFCLLPVSVHAYAQETPVTTTNQEATVRTTTITAASGKNLSNLTDNSYNTAVSFSADDTITITSTEMMYGIYVIWNAPTDEWTLTYNSKSIPCGQNGFLHEYVAIDEGTTSCTIHFTKAESICDITAYSAGVLPSNVEVWEPSCDRADFLVFSTHADDEILFLGGVLATYGGEHNHRVQVVYMTNYWNGLKIREHEKLDGLWASGIRYYPVNGSFDDLYATSLAGAKSVYNPDEITGFVTEQIRRFKPLVCVTQDINGEYGHGGHMLLAESIQNAVNNSADVSFYPESATTYGTWDVPKTYLHLYPENAITMNLRVPLSHFGGQTALEVAAAAYKQHVSQQWCWFYVSDEYEYSCANFGLFRTTVGADTNNDMLEHITPYAVQEQQERERLEAESQAASIAQSEAEISSIAAEVAAEQSVKRKSMLKTAAIIIGVILIVVLCGGFILSKKKASATRTRKQHRR